MIEVLTNWWAGFLVMIAIALLAVSFIMQLHEWGIRPLRDVSKILNCPWFERLLLLFFVCGMVQYAATKGTGNGSRSSGTETRNDTVDEIEMTALRSGNSQEFGEITNLCFTGIAVLTNGVELNIAWTTNFLVLGTTLDFFAKYQILTNAWQWFAYYPTSPGMTNLTVVVDWKTNLGCASNPPTMFFKVQDRATCAATMADADGDGLPDIYELDNGTNPYVSDYALAPKLTVGDGGDYATISAALAASTNYSIVELSSEAESLDQTVVLPSHPVLITGPRDGYARLYSSADIAAFLLDDGQDRETVFRNLYVVLTARSNFQSAFWIGGNLPWSGVGASPTFENVRVRALYPNVLHYGWHYHRDNNDSSSLSNCVMNAAGSTSTIGLYSYGGPNIVTSECAFVNFPTNAGNCASWIKAGTNVVATLPAANTNLSWAGYVLDQSYSSTVDSDGDGLSDYAEIYDHNTDPWLPDSDGDGLTDAEEPTFGTDPRSWRSFSRHIAVETIDTDDLSDTTNYVAWGVLHDGWETNGLSICWTFPATNAYDLTSSNGMLYVKSFRDLNRNGLYDEDSDIILIKTVSSLESISNISFQFGDIDDDGCPDYTEKAHGTDPFDAENYCFNLSFVEKGIFSTTNALTAEVLFGTNVIVGPTTMTNRTWEVDVGHLVASNRETVVAYFWDDANSNGVRDTEECYARQILTLKSHDNVLTNTLAMGAFDRDSDGMLDYWELLHTDAGLSPTNAADALLDADGDGLINYHEYLTGNNPRAYDGTNTAIYAAIHSVDDRISNLTASVAWPMYHNFKDNIRTNVPPIVIENTNCWAYSIFASRFSLWCSDTRSWHDYFMHELNLVTPQHAITATHCAETTNAVYMFVGLSGIWHTRRIQGKYSIPNTDITVCLLNDPVPTNDVRITPMLPLDYAQYLGTLHRIPTVFIDQEKNIVVQEVIKAPQSMTERSVPLVCGRGHTSVRSSFYQQAIGHDSGSPCYLLLGTQPVFLCAVHARDSSNEGASVAENATLYSVEIQAAMDELSDTFGFRRHLIERVDLSGYASCRKD